MWQTTVVVIVFLSVSAVEGFRCFDCKGAVDINNCTRIRECSSNEHCHTRKYVDGLGTNFFDLNCRPTALCSKLESDPLSKKEAADGLQIELWTSCCAQDYCNVKFDKDGKYLDTSKQTMECYNCQDIADPGDCTSFQTCKAGDVCVTHEKIGDNGAKRFDMGCLPRKICKDIGFHLIPAKKRHVKRLELCRGCCDQRSKCNNQFCSTKLGQTNMTALGTQIPTEPSTTTQSTTQGTTTTGTPTTSGPSTKPVDPYTLYKLKVIPANRTTPLGSTVVFECEFETMVTDTMKVSWYFTAPSGTPKLLQSKGALSPPVLDMFIQHVQKTDVGTYECRAEFGRRLYKATGVLDVESYVDILMGPSTLALSAGDKATLTCRVDGIPAPTVTWMRMKNERTTNVTKGVTAITDGSQLVINSVKASDAALYKCVASNSDHTKEALAVLTVA